MTLTTEILDEKEGYYAFKDTVFFGAKGGQESDKGWINQQPVEDLRWEGDLLYHKVGQSLSNPIHMQVDKEVRYQNTIVQTALHYLDGYYNAMGMTLIAVGVQPGHQWYELDVDQISEELLADTEAHMAKIIEENIPTSFTYMSGAEYPDPFYQQFNELRLVHLGDYNTQPCGTPHIRHSGQIGSFTILDTEKTKKGIRILFAVQPDQSQLMKTHYHRLKDAALALNTRPDDLVDRINELVKNQKDLKNQIKDLKKDYFDLLGHKLAQSSEFLVTSPIEDRSDLQILGQSLLRQTNQDKVFLSNKDQDLFFAFISPSGQARDYMKTLKDQYPEVKGGGSPQIVTGSLSNQTNLEDFQAFLETTVKSNN